MALELKQQVKLSQQLVMTPQLQQAIKLLQLSRLELQNTIQQELVENPMLEEALEEEQVASGVDDPEVDETPTPVDEVQVEAQEAPEAEQPEPTTDDVVGDVDWENYMESRPQTSLSRGDDDRPPLESTLTEGTNLTDHLLWQLGFADLDERGRQLGTMIICNLNDDGYLDESIDSIADTAGVPVDEAVKVLERVQTLDPVGVAARSLSECLLVQMRVAQVKHPLVLKVTAEHLDLLQRKDYRRDQSHRGRHDRRRRRGGAHHRQLRAASRSPVRGRGPRLHHARYLRAQDRRRVPRGPERGRALEAEGQSRVPRRAVEARRRVEGRARVRAREAALGAVADQVDPPATAHDRQGDGVHQSASSASSSTRDRSSCAR